MATIIRNGIIKEPTYPLDETRLGSDCSGSSPSTGRVLTLQNTSQTRAPVSVLVEGQPVSLADVTFNHLSSNSTLTFNNIEIYNADTIKVEYYI